MRSVNDVVAIDLSLAPHAHAVMGLPATKYPPTALLAKNGWSISADQGSAKGKLSPDQ